MFKQKIRADLQFHHKSAVQPRKRFRRVWWILGAVIGVVLIAGIFAGPLMSQVEQPEYRVETQDGAIEIRAYPPLIAAEAAVEGDRKAAIRKGFGLIAAYIFGNNAPNAKIAMTAPVEQQKQVKIAMTAPVTQEARANAWVVRFIMPKQWTLETLPKPKDERVTLTALPERRFAVIRFSGRARDETLKTKTDELNRYIADHKLNAVGEPVLAFYNPPWTLPFFRRNEIMRELARGAAQ